MITVRVPGDKSISHRAALLAPLAVSESVIRGLSNGDDVQASLAVMNFLGANIVSENEAGGGVTIRVGESMDLRGSDLVLDCGNSGTTARLLSGILVGLGVGGVLDGDDSLRGRPMRRITYPLQAMGGRLDCLGEPERLPLRFSPRASGMLRTLRHRVRTASAQVKSAVLLAGVTGRVEVGLYEPTRSRDHTERMLTAMGVPVDFDPTRTGAGEVRFDPRDWDGRLRGLDFTVPGDASSAAFLLGAALICRQRVRVENVGANPGRTAFLEVLEEMGATVVRQVHPARGGEPVETWVLTPPDQLEHFEIGGDQIPALIDEVPLLAVLASRAGGRSDIRDAAELRVKETDRIRGLVTNLSALGVDVSEREDGLSIEGSCKSLVGNVLSWGDHRMAMAFGVLGLAKEVNIAIDAPDCCSASFPGFLDAIGVFEDGS